MVNNIYLFHHQSPNFGDYIAKEIVEKLSNKNIISISENEITMEHYIVTGSILTQANNNSIVWGAGVAYYDDKIPKVKNVFAVRGKLTAQKIKINGFSCDVVGDPVMLISDLYKPNIIKKYKLGIIPHWIDYYTAMLFYRDIDDIIVIDLLKKPDEIISEIAQCEKTISSSLHGIVASHSLNIPCSWVKFSDKVLGDGYKFDDYYSSIGIDKFPKPKTISYRTDINEIINSIEYIEIKFDKKEFIKSCPFIDNKKMELI
jgi:hypothetical protein